MFITTVNTGGGGGGGGHDDGRTSGGSRGSRGRCGGGQNVRRRTIAGGRVDRISERVIIQCCTYTTRTHDIIQCHLTHNQFILTHVGGCKCCTWQVRHGTAPCGHLREQNGAVSTEEVERRRLHAVVAPRPGPIRPLAADPHGCRQRVNDLRNQYKQT